MSEMGPYDESFIMLSQDSRETIAQVDGKLVFVAGLLICAFIRLEESWRYKRLCSVIRCQSPPVTCDRRRRKKGNIHKPAANVYARYAILLKVPLFVERRHVGLCLS
jgi:hypothetical protein